MKACDAHLGVIQNTQTGMFHGAVFRNHPTPSGCERYLLSRTINEGFTSNRDAALSVNEAFPDLPALDLSHLPVTNVNIIDLPLPRGAMLTHIIPMHTGGVMEASVRDVEVRAYASPLAPLFDILVTVAQLKQLEETGKIVFDGTSGRYPNLYYHYDHYVAV